MTAKIKYTEHSNSKAVDVLSDIKFTQQDKKVFAMQKAEKDKKAKDKAVEFSSRMEIPTVPTVKCEVQFPKGVIKMFGCDACDWRGLWLCPLKLTPRDKRRHKNSICYDRRNFLQIFTNSYEKQPTFSRWHRDFMVNRGALIERKEYVNIQKIEDKLYKLNAEPINEDDDPKVYLAKVKKLETDLKHAKNQWHVLWKDIVTMEDKQVDRETPKQIDMQVTKHNIPHNQILNIMRGDYKVSKDKVKDAEFEEVEEDEE